MGERCGAAYFRVTHVDNNNLVSFNLFHELWIDELKDFSVIEYPTIDWEAMGTRSGEPVLLRKRAYVKTKLVEKVKSHALSTGEGKFRPGELFNYIQAYCGRMFIGTDVVVRNEPLDAEVAYMLAYAVYTDVYRMKYDYGKCNQSVM